MINIKRNFTAKEWLEELTKRKKFWKNKHAVNITLRTLGKLGVRYLRTEAPSDSGKLKSSFSYKLLKQSPSDGQGVFTSRQEYAQFVNDGTSDSEGGFIPAIEKRLSKRYLKRKNIKSTKLKRHPGTRANPYQDRAANKVVKVAVKEIMKAFKKRGYLINLRGDVA